MVVGSPLNDYPAPHRPPVSMLRPALELSWAVAKVGSQARPPLPVPGRLRPIMRVARLPDRMLETVRQVVDDDDVFRERVAAAATDEKVLGRPSWLWLVRPEGWEAELADLVQQHVGAESDQRKKRDAEAAARQLDEVTAGMQRLQAELVALKAVNEELRESASRQRKENRANESDAGELRRRLREASNENERLRALNEDLEASLAAHRAELAGVAGERAEDLSRLTAFREEVHAAVGKVEDAELRARLAESEVSRLRALLSRAEAGARELAERIAAEFGPPARSIVVEDDADADTSPEDEPVVGQRHSGTLHAVPGPRRRRAPVSLPPAIFEDSPQAAEHLVRVPGVLVVVDGYNVTLTSWPSLGLAEQRRRLVDSLAELVMRAGTEVMVVFDGVDAGNRLQPPAAVRGRLKVQFSPSEVEADDVIIGKVESVSPDRPVAVATNDRRVRDSASRLGANVISVDQLLAVLGRGAGG